MISAERATTSTIDSPSWTHERARVARLSQCLPPDAPALADARRDLRAARAEEYIRKLVDATPPLTPEQTARLSALLAPVVPGAAA